MTRTWIVAGLVALGAIILLIESSTDSADRPESVRIVYLVVLLAVLATAFIVRRSTPSSVMIRHALIWIAIGVALFAAYTVKDDLGPLGDRMLGELLPDRGIDSGPRSVSFRTSGDGHHHVAAEIDGARVRMLVDTGASDVTLTQADARRIGFDTTRLVFTQRYMTANGMVRGAPVVLREVKIGPIVVRNVRASVSEGALASSLLGLSYLNRLEGYAVSGGTLTLTGRGP
ncbi:MAG TPA: TIGR02281 family clan AA aspartic protease [Alphaproteobacteria bacterium]